MINYVNLDPPVTITVAGSHRLSGIGKAVLVVIVVDHLGAKHSVQLLVTIVPGLGRHSFAGGKTARKRVNMVVSNNSYLDLGEFQVPLRKGNNSSTLGHLDLNTAAEAAERQASEIAFPTVSDDFLRREATLAAFVSTTASSARVGANIWHM